jgi:hypothetical protein
MVAKALDLAKQRRVAKDILDCFVALLLAMTEKHDYFTNLQFNNAKDGFPPARE